MSLLVWRTLPLRRVVRIIGGGTPASNKEFWDGEIPFATPKDLRPINGGTLRDTARSITQAGLDQGSALAPVGSVLLSVRAPIGYVVAIEAPAAFSQGCKALLPDESQLNSAFLLYALQACGAKFEAAANGTTFMELSATGIAETEISLPDLVTQARIVRFLDEETAKIDNLIKKQDALIDLLEQRKVSLIENIVFEGKVGDAIDKHLTRATSRRIKNIFKLRDDTNTAPREDVTLLSLYTKHGIRPYDDISDEERSGNPVRTVDGYKVVHSGDIVVNIILAWMGAIGYSPYDGVISPAYDIWYPTTDVCIKYWHYLFRTRWFSGECFKRGRGIMMMRWRTYADQFGDIRVPFPPLEQQWSIANRVDTQIAQIDAVVIKCRSSIELLRERRSTLITAAVTGQIEV